MPTEFVTTSTSALGKLTYVAFATAQGPSTIVDVPIFRKVIVTARAPNLMQLASAEVVVFKTLTKMAFATISTTVLGSTTNVAFAMALASRQGHATARVTFLMYAGSVVEKEIPVSVALTNMLVTMTQKLSSSMRQCANSVTVQGAQSLARATTIQHLKKTMEVVSGVSVSKMVRPMKVGRQVTVHSI